MLFSNNPFIKDTFRIIGEIIIVTSSVNHMISIVKPLA